MITILISVFGAAMGGLFVMQYNANAFIHKVSESVLKLSETVESFMGDRKDKDKAYYAWKEGIDKMKVIHDIYTKDDIPNHNAQKT